MNLTKHYQSLNQFARFCLEWHIDPTAAARMLQLARTAARAGAAECSKPGADASKARYEFQRAAEQCGFTVQWPGLWPTVIRYGKTIHLPDCHQ